MSQVGLGGNASATDAFSANSTPSQTCCISAAKADFPPRIEQTTVRTRFSYPSDNPIIEAFEKIHTFSNTTGNPLLCRQITGQSTACPEHNATFDVRHSVGIQHTNRAAMSFTAETMGRTALPFV
jgi:hypothetical protein